MDDEEIFQKIKNLIISCDSWDDIEVVNISMDMILDDTVYDCEIIQACEDLFDVDFDGCNMMDIHTIRQLVELIGIKLADKPFKL